jgi:predicted RNase H-like nuclease (RuvC/YqgF family)
LVALPARVNHLFSGAYEHNFNHVDFAIKKPKPSNPDLTSSEANDAYWKELASEREKALNETIEENDDLKELLETINDDVSGLEKENETLKEENSIMLEKANRLDSLTETLNVLINE